MYSNQLRAFHAVATHGGFTKAAQKLGLTQPALSDHVRKLEQRFQVELFHRHKRKVFLSELGRRLLEITRRQFELEDEAVQLLQDSQLLDTGNLRIAAAAPLHIVDIVAAFQASYPGIRISMTQGNSEEVLRQVLEYQADIGELGHAPADERLLVIPLRSDPLVAFMANEHRWAVSGRISLAQLSKETLVLREAGSATRRIADAELARLGIEPKYIMEVEGREACREAVAAGLGVGLVSEPEFGHDRRLTSVTLSDCTAVMTEALVCLKDRANLRLIAAFLDEARSSLEEEY